jgi:hypothetical protein
MSNWTIAVLLSWVKTTLCAASPPGTSLTSSDILNPMGREER